MSITSDMFVFHLFLIQPASQMPVWLNDVQEASSLCKVFLVGEQKQNHEKHQEAGADVASHSMQLLVQNAENDIGQTSSNRQQVLISIVG